jgi:hypothetical protein
LPAVATGGRFSTAQWSSSAGADFGRGPVEPETIAGRWHDISDM